MVDAFRKAIQSLPICLLPEFNVVPPNEPCVLYEGPYSLLQKHNQSANLFGRITYKWFPSPHVRFEGKPMSGISVETGSAVLSIRRPYVSGSVRITGLGRRLITGSAEGPLVIGKNLRVKALKFHLPNFHHYVGSRVRFPHATETGWCTSRIELKSGDWKLTLDQDPSYGDLEKKLRKDGGYGIGHTGLLSRIDGSGFKLDETNDFRECMYWFFSFLRGLRCGPILISGMGQNKTLWSEWNSWRVSPYKETQSWFPHGTISQELNFAFERFAQHCKDPMWKQALSEIIHWYIEANTNSTALEGSIVLGHLGLESLAWLHVVSDRKSMTEAQFDKLANGSPARISMALESMGISTQIPSRFQRLIQIGQRRRITSAPQLICKVRNCVVHPTPKNSQFLDQFTNIDRFNVASMCIRYLELGMLSTLNYNGGFSDRLSEAKWKGDDVEPVPWASPKT